MSKQPDPPLSQQSQNPPPAKRVNPLLPGGWIALVVLAILAILYFTYSPHREIEYSQFVDLIKAGQVKKIILIGNDRAEGEVRDPNSDIAKSLKLGSGKFGVNLLHTNDQPSLIREWEAMDQKARDELKKQKPDDNAEKLAITKR